MPRTKKPFVDKKDPKTHTFSLVHRSQRDPLGKGLRFCCSGFFCFLFSSFPFPLIPFLRQARFLRIQETYSATIAAVAMDTCRLFADLYALGKLATARFLLHQ